MRPARSRRGSQRELQSFDDVDPHAKWRQGYLALAPLGVSSRNQAAASPRLTGQTPVQQLLVDTSGMRISSPLLSIRKSHHTRTAARTVSRSKMPSMQR